MEADALSYYKDLVSQLKQSGIATQVVLFETQFPDGFHVSDSLAYTHLKKIPLQL